MMQNLIRNVAFLVAISLGGVATQAQAGFVGSFGVNADSPAITMPAGNNLATATVLTIASIDTNGNTTGGFSGIGLAAGTPFSGGTIYADPARRASLSPTVPLSALSPRPSPRWSSHPVS